MRPIKPASGVVCSLFLLSLLSALHASEICKAQIDCPVSYDGDTVRVANNVVILSNVFAHCAPDSIYEGVDITPGETDTVSVLFVIDQSGSMTIMDPDNVRYQVVNDLIDELYARSPASEVGVVVFSNKLMHSYGDDSWFVQLNPQSGWTDSYVPLTRLNEVVDGFRGDQRVKRSIQLSDTEVDVFGMPRLVNGNYGNTGRHHGLSTDSPAGFLGGTDIALAMDAARHAFQNASNSADKQFIIFLSDGVAQSVDYERVANIRDHVQGVGLPTTYTAYFINQNEDLPQELVTMTNNIKNHGYSSTNPRSRIWRHVGSQGGLLSLFISELEPWIEPFLGVYKSTPLALNINGVDALSFDSINAYFPEPFFPLQGTVTEMDITYTYRFTTTPVPFETTKNYSVTVMQSNFPDVESVECWIQDSIVVYDGGNRVVTVTGDMNRLEARLYPVHEEKESVRLIVQNSTGTDSISLNLQNSGSYWTQVFDWEYGDPRSDNVLQLLTGDSIVLIYRNPLIPLDTVRVSLPVVPQRDVAVRNAFYLDNNGDGYPDVIKVIQGSERLSARECSLLVESISIRTDRAISITSVVSDPDGFLIYIKADTGEPFTGLYPRERLFINSTSLPSGGVFPFTEMLIADSMAPVIISALYLDVANSRDTLRITFSENVRDIVTQEPFTFKRDGQTYLLTVDQINSSGNVVTFTAVASSSVTPTLGDSVRINVAGNVLDSVGNNQLNVNNRNVLLEYQRLYKTLKAFYHDTSGNGLIDLVTINTDRIVDSLTLNAYISSLVLPAHRNFRYTASDFFVTDSGFAIRVTQLGSEPNTSVDSRDVVTVSTATTNHGSALVEARIRVEDRMPPIVIGAIYIPSDDETGRIPDTLIVTLSERIDPPSTRFPFTFVDSTGETYKMELVLQGERGNGEYAFTVISIEGRSFPGINDSLFIDPLAEVKDLAGNIQDSPNRKAPLSIQKHGQQYQIIVTPNPFNPDVSNPINAKVRSYYGIDGPGGMFIIVEPLSRASKDNGITGTMKVYDVVGNIVASYNGRQGTDNVLYFVWDGRNRKGRLAGNGAYLLVFDITDPFGDLTRQTVKAGITRK